MLLIKVLSWKNEAKPEQKKNGRNEGKNGITSTSRKTSRANRPSAKKIRRTISKITLQVVCV